MASQTPESKLKSDVIDALNSLGLFYRRMHSGGTRVKRGFLYLGPEGTADFLVFMGRDPYWIELKAPKQTTTKARKMAQAAFRDEVLALGHDYAICESVDDVLRFLA